MQSIGAVRGDESLPATIATNPEVAELWLAGPHLPQGLTKIHWG